MSAVPFMQIIGALNIISAFGNSGRFMLLALGRAKVSALSGWASVLPFAILATAVFPHAGAAEIATLRLAVGAFSLLTSFFLMKREMRTLRLREV